MKPSDVLRGALDRLGPTGERWAGDWSNPKSECMYVALHAAGKDDFQAFMRAWRLVADECNDHSDLPRHLSVIEFNDDPKTTFSDVALTFKRALARAEDEERA